MPEPTRAERLPRAFVDPASVAVVGASDDRAKWGYWLARGALAGAGRREVWLVNRRASTILGRVSHQDVTELPGTPELVVLCVPAAQLRPVVEAALAKGCRAFLAITAGLGPEHDDLVALLRRSGARMIGPNSLGLFRAATELQLAWGEFTAGRLAVVSQSGQLGSEIASLAARVGLGVSCFYSVGNQLDVAAVDILESLVDDADTTTVALYLESFAGGGRIVAALRALRRAGKHVLVLTTGASDGSRRLARSHTGSMTSALDVVDAACRAAGALRVATPAELVDVARLLDVDAMPGGRRVAVVSDSGGQGAIAADVAAAQGLVTPVFSEALQARLRDQLPASAAVANPVDLAGAGEADLQVYARLVELVAASGEVDAVLLSGYLGCYGEDSPSLQDAELAVVDRLGSRGPVPLVVHSMSAGSAAVARMGEHGIPAFPAVDAALSALGRATAFGRASGVDPTAAGGPATLLAHTAEHAPIAAPGSAAPSDGPASALGGTAALSPADGRDRAVGLGSAVAVGSAVEGGPADPGRGSTFAGTAVPSTAVGLGVAAGFGCGSAVDPAAPPCAAEVPGSGYWAAREFLAAHGVAVPDARRVSDDAEVAKACTELRSPFVLKAAWIEHKSELGAVRTGLTPDTAVAAFRGMFARLGPGAYVLEEQDTRGGVVEMLIGGRRDRDFGPTVAVGFGGVQAELWRDVALELAPVDRATAARMLARLRSHALLDGWRGQPAVDVDALTNAIVAVSEAIARTDEIDEIEINPIRVAPEGALAVDALVLSRGATTTTINLHDEAGAPA
ncbi:acetate--CoA ligase family protein [Streptacidiphilus jiangxiensis]|uniref:Acyl-CoA synthetase (NDP forming) n=1 Tax=Streptacidiphilus jiangxiensis TaxID=235985 RepID=A0A1H7WT90_STRJI|nr:acetate--CoA ligase family protein [Streptacidiphilus jiangxiensis]SEM24742.1 Acyl-CoA synthetase (NDP forming) [Streptacidiphilus jiangxiensis]